MYVLGTTRLIKRVYTGMRAEQLINGATKIVISLSFQSEMVLADMIPGMAHATLESSGTTLLPFRPKGLMRRSMIKTTRDK